MRSRDGVLLTLGAASRLGNGRRASVTILLALASSTSRHAEESVKTAVLREPVVTEAKPKSISCFVDNRAELRLIPTASWIRSRLASIGPPVLSISAVSHLKLDAPGQVASFLM
jgi:hypothetical protein